MPSQGRRELRLERGDDAAECIAGARRRVRKPPDAVRRRVDAIVGVARRMRRRDNGDGGVPKIFTCGYLRRQVRVLLVLDLRDQRWGA